MFEQLTEAAFIAYIKRVKAAGSETTGTALEWFASNLFRQTITKDGDWLSNGHGNLIRVPRWAEKYPAKVTAEDLK